MHAWMECANTYVSLYLNACLHTLLITTTDGFHGSAGVSIQKCMFKKRKGDIRSPHSH